MHNDITIRPEQPSDYAQIREMTLPAFAAAYGTGDVEADLIEALRTMPDYDPALALVALRGDVVVGLVMLSPVSIQGNGGQQWPALCAAPLGVRIGHQRQGIGSALMLAVLERARERGQTRVVLAGSHEYYPRFGFVDAIALGIRDDMGTPAPHFMVLALVEDALTGVSGVVCYPSAFDVCREPEA